jgi:hypothetical protein
MTRAAPGCPRNTACRSPHTATVRRLEDTRGWQEASGWSLTEKADSCGAGLGGRQEWGVLVGNRKTEFCFDVLGGGESFEGHEVEPDTVIGEARHRPCQFSQREEVDRFGKARHCLDGRSSQKVPALPTARENTPSTERSPDGPTKTLIPQARCEEATTAGA